MKYKKNVVLIISFFIILFLLLLTFVVIKKLNNKEEYLYEIHLFEDYDPGKNYNIYVYDNYEILVVSQSRCSAVECMNGEVSMPKEEKKVIFSNDGKKFLKKYFEDLFEEDSNYISFNSSELNDYNKNVIRSIVSNNEEKLYEDIYTLYYTSNEYRYNIHLKDDEIVVDRIEICDGCNRKNRSYNLDFSDDNMKVVKDFINNIFSNVRSYEFDLNDIELSEIEKSIVDSIILNDESCINSEYLFIISDSSCNCIPNFVYFYSDKTYVVKGINNKVISEGEYELDPKILINELTENGTDSDDERGMNYYIKLYNGDEYWISHNNKVIKEFLRGLDIKWY